METWTEGLKNYRVLEEVSNSYFLDVEYHVLRRNRISELLAIQVRDQDGSCRLLYDMSGLQSIKAVTESHILTCDEYRQFLTDCCCLVRHLDEYMLDIRQISFKPEDIYQDNEGHYHWMYIPEAAEDISSVIVKLFEWLLSVIDYGEIKTVQFAYHAYWSIRNHTFSEQMLRECLDYTGEDIARYPSMHSEEPEGQSMALDDRSQLHDSDNSFVRKDSEIRADVIRRGRDDNDVGHSSATAMSGRQTYYSDYFHGSAYASDSKPTWQSSYAKDRGSAQDEEWHQTAGNSSSRRRLFLAAEIFCIVMGTLATMGFIFLLVFGIRQGISREMVYIYILIVISILILYDCAWQLHRNRSKAGEDGESVKRKSSPKEVPAPSYNYSWDEAGGTEVLGVRKDMMQPALRNMKNGDIFTMEDFPFYIGSDSDSNNLVIDAAGVSRHHAAIIRGKQTGFYDLQDLCSTNGTWLNQKALIYEKPARLKAGDEIRFATERYEFMILDCPMGEYSPW